MHARVKKDLRLLIYKTVFKLQHTRKYVLKFHWNLRENKEKI